jgi:hypothetical protein
MGEAPLLLVCRAPTKKLLGVTMATRNIDTLCLSRETRALLQQRQDVFRAKFGRDPRPMDPLLFDPDADEPRPLDEQRVKAAMVEAMGSAGFDPAAIYAFQKTDLIAITQDAGDLEGDDLAAWRAAMYEYHVLVNPN